MQRLTNTVHEKSVGITELHYSTKKWYHVLGILKKFLHSTLVRVKTVNWQPTHARRVFLAKWMICNHCFHNFKLEKGLRGAVCLSNICFYVLLKGIFIVETKGGMWSRFSC